MSLFRKPKKNLRNRIELDNDEDDPNNDDIDEIHQNINKLKEKKKEKKKNKDEKPKEKKNTLLSFDDEEEEEVTEFKVKKSKESRRLIKMREKEKKDELNHKNGKSHSNDDVQLVDSKNGKNKHVHIIDDDIGIVMKDNVDRKPQDTWVISGKEAEALHMEEEDFSDEENESDEDEDPLKKIIQSGGIPDAAVIHAARKKREAARASGGGGNPRDYIPIKKKDEVTKVKRGPRLVREEDEDEADEDRVDFTIKQTNKEDEYHRKAAKSDTDSEPETWEKMQISKVINNQQLMSVSKDVGNGGDGSMPRAPQPPTISGDKRQGSGLVKPGNYDLAGIRDRMKSRLEDMKEVHRRHEMDADRAVDDIVESQTKIDQMGEDIPNLSRNYKFYQELRGYMTDLTDCYDEKMITIGYLESRIDKVYSEQRGKIRERRRQDIGDQSEVLSAMTASNMAAMVDPVQDAVRDYRAAEREGRRMRRRQGRENRGETAACHNDGMSSDDELPSQDANSLAKVREDVEVQARLAMEDVVEEFSVLGNVMDRLQSWRQKDEDSYKSAYVSLCLPKIFSPLIRLEMLFWSPLEDASPMSKCDWFSTLATYAILNEDKYQEWELDPDRNLISSCSEKIILPRLVTIVKSSYDPMSTSQTRNLVTFLTKLVSDCPTISARSPQVRELLSGVVDSIRDSLDHDVYIPIYTNHQMDNSQHAQFANRQFWTVFKLYKNVLSWAGILSDGVLAELVLDKLLNRYLLMSLRANQNNNESVFKSKQIVDVLPAWWLEAGSVEMAKLSMFTRFMSGLGCCQGLSREAIIEVARILRILGDYETGEKLRELLY